MRSAVPKPITTKRSHKPALRASEPSRKEPPAAAVSISHKGHGIAELAQELADLHSLCTMLSNAEGPAERARNELAAKDIDCPEHSKCCRAVRDFEDVGRRANGMVDGLEKLILGLEPITPDETLSLALILAEELDVFIANHTNHADSCVEAEGRRLEDALQAIIRGLVHSAGATSPLLAHCAHRDTLRPWDEARSTATREAAPYLVAYDPMKGRLTNGRAAP
jgi:hypothetical protein